MESSPQKPRAYKIFRHYSASSCRFRSQRGGVVRTKKPYTSRKHRVPCSICGKLCKRQGLSSHVRFVHEGNNPSRKLTVTSI